MRDRTTSITGIFNSIDPDIPHNAGSFRRVKVQLREGCVAGIPRFPHSCSMATTNVADRLVCTTQAAFAELGDGFGLAEGGMGMPPYSPSSPASTAAMATALRQPAVPRLGGRSRRAQRRRLADLLIPVSRR